MVTGFLLICEAPFVHVAKSVYLFSMEHFFMEDLWNVYGMSLDLRIELLCAFVNSIYLHAQMHLGEHLTQRGSLKQRLGVNLEVLISCHHVHALYIPGYMFNALFLFVFLPMQRY